ncbi:penicillin-binding transpeptidase domain-containing protein [uncultured Corynebacterium sp.]|uniref:penicillin-binding transpeptidase domain-containing protein n=1 Tax=uncultured Corynebacterium sp. TaxID=159447 RepID=UPI0025DF0F39|nr:penicillin-binding transpeptidase domain-containing protein [uncultured Corynebacterium sp.]
MKATPSRRRLTALFTAAAMAATTVACTPRPDTGEDVLEEFFGALETGDVEAAAQLTDHVDTARRDLGAAWDGLDAEAVEAEIGDVRGDGGRTTADVNLDWDLVGDREWEYDTTFHLTKSDSRWAVRWTPSSLHPRLGSNQHPELRRVPAPRASVVGSDGASLLEPGTVHRVVVDRSAVSDVQAAVNRVATVVNNGMPDDGDGAVSVDAREIGSRAAGGSGPFSVVVLPADAPPQVREDLEQIDGVSVNDEAAMVRPDPGFAPDLMSRVERVVADDVSGGDGWSIVAANADGGMLASLHSVEPEIRPAIRASVSKKVQDAAQRAVDLRSEAEVMLVAVRPSSGEVLAVAQTSKADERGDLALMGQFPPGSTFKIVTAAAGMDNLGLDPSSTVPCPGTMTIGPRVVTNYNGSGVGDTSLTDAFARSCNTTFADISYRMEPGQLQDEAEEFGIGVDYRIAGLDTITGSVSDGEDVAERIDAGYGQGFDLTSPFGMAMVSATVAAGRTPTPSLVPHAGTWQSATPDPLEPDTLDRLRGLMRAVVTSGTATAIADRGEVFGKTGEAEVAGGSHSWFTGWRDDIAFATLIVHGGGSEHAVAVTDAFLANLDEGPEGPGTEG